MSDSPWAIFLNGSYGVGKSSTLNHVADLLTDSGQPFSLLDQDWFFAPVAERIMRHFG